jgi:hypothetical protein
MAGAIPGDVSAEHRYREDSKIYTIAGLKEKV